MQPQPGFLHPVRQRRPDLQGLALVTQCTTASSANRMTRSASMIRTFRPPGHDRQEPSGRCSGTCGLRAGLAAGQQHRPGADWVIDLDVARFSDSVDHDLMVRAVEANTDQKWVVLYVKRWLKAPIQMPDGRVAERDRGTPHRAQRCDQCSPACSCITRSTRGWSESSRPWSSNGSCVRDSYRLITTLPGYRRYPAAALVRPCHERWEIETACLALRHTLLNGHVLRSGDRPGLEQELWALLTRCQLLRMAMVTAAGTRLGTSPDRASFTSAMEAARDQFTGARAVCPGSAGRDPHRRRRRTAGPIRDPPADRPVHRGRARNWRPATKLALFNPVRHPLEAGDTIQRRGLRYRREASTSDANR